MLSHKNILALSKPDNYFKQKQVRGRNLFAIENLFATELS